MEQISLLNLSIIALIQANIYCLKKLSMFLYFIKLGLKSFTNSNMELVLVAS